MKGSQMYVYGYLGTQLVLLGMTSGALAMKAVVNGTTEGYGNCFVSHFKHGGAITCRRK